jgi:hypothetical protein
MGGRTPVARRCPVRTWFTLAVLLALPRSAWAADRPPNVLLVVADDLRADVTSVYRGPVKTPNLEALADRGSVFDRATCGYPICHVSRARGGTEQQACSRDRQNRARNPAAQMCEIQPTHVIYIPRMSVVILSGAGAAKVQTAAAANERDFLPFSPCGRRWQPKAAG